MSNAPVSAKTNGLAIASLVLGIVGVSIVAIILGHISLNQIKNTGEQGRGMALAGTILGYVGLVFTIIWIIVAVVFAAAYVPVVY
jgi:peptidoglycan biosynthesis protein MviN/MurJ (putative lipid II flippase)